MTTESDTRLAIAQLYDAYTPALLRYLKRLTGSREEAEDLAQETFLKALRHWDQLEANTNVQAWLFRIARNVAYDSFRRRRGPTLEQGDLELDRLPAQAVHAEQLRKHVHRLSRLPLDLPLRCEEEPGSLSLAWRSWPATSRAARSSLWSGCGSSCSRRASGGGM